MHTSHTRSFVSRHFKGFLSTLALALLAAAGTSAYAMDPRYQDKDGDMVADAPTDPKDWIDPATLVFAYTPVEDPAVYAKVWDGFIQHMAQVTGKKVQFFPVQSNAAQLEAMRAGRLHVAGFNTGSNPLAVNCAGFVPFAMMVSNDERYGYEMEIITYPGSGIEKVEDSLDPKTARQVMRLILELCHEHGLAAIVNIHDVMLATEFLPRIVGLRQGAIVYDGPATGVDRHVLTAIYGDEDWTAITDRVARPDDEPAGADARLALAAAS